MERKDEIITLLKQRADMYRFLARIFVLEPDAELLTKMRQMVFPADCADPDLADGYALLQGYLSETDFHNSAVSEDQTGETYAGTDGNPEKKDIASTVTELEVEYARIFLAAGEASGGAAFPYESVYTSKKHLVNQESREDVMMLYSAKGLKPREDMYRIPDDHAGLEFEYMARLIETAASAAESEDEAGLDAGMKEQREFFREHLKRWVPMFGEDIRKYARTDFYRGIGRVTRGFMALETQLLQ